jgi:dimethylargininase
VELAMAFEQRHAIVRPVPKSYDHCVRTNTERIYVDLAKQQHKEYCKVLERLGLKLVWVKGDDALPDSCFVEDTAFVFGEKAIICNMSVNSRAPEVIGVAEVLAGLKKIHHVKPPGMIDGGDVLKVEDRVFTGLSARTNSEAVEQVGKILRGSGLDVVPVNVHNVLHLKSACTYLGDNCVVLSKGNFDTNVLSGLRKIVVAKGEKYATDCLVVNGTVLMAKGYPETKRLIENESFRVEELEMSEFKKGEGALTCLSIIW